MNIDYLIQLLTNRLNGLALAKDQAFIAGDLERINVVDAEILDVQNTVSKLKLLASIEQTALATSFTEAEVVKNGIEASFNPTIINDATKCLLDYDITPYATDEFHEMKIQTILERMGPMISPEQVELYIKKTSPDTPLSGDMIFNSASQFGVDVRLMMALMELDSRFGTLGVAVQTLNPGNVGNTGKKKRTFDSWQEGVDAVAKWLDTHRRVQEIAPFVLTPTIEEPAQEVQEQIVTPEPVVESEPVLIEEVGSSGEVDGVVPEEPPVESPAEAPASTSESTSISSE